MRAYALIAITLAHTALAQDSARVTAPATAAPAPGPMIGPPIRRIATAAAVSKEKLGSVTSVRELPDGRVLLNDGTSRRLLLLDTLLNVERVVLDSTSETENTYGARQGFLMAHRADSALFIDPLSLAMLIIDPTGNIARVRSVPGAQNSYMYTQGGASQVGVDSRGRIVYRMYAQAAPPVKAPPRGVPWFPEEPDSAFVVALDMDTRKLDTLGSFRIPKQDYVVKVSANGGWNFNSMINPLPRTDEWALLPDGAVAFVRSIDYRVEYRSPDGTWTSSEKLPFDWQPYSDSAKQRLVDSVRNAETRSIRNSYTTSMIRWVNTYKRKYPPNFTAPEGYRPPNGFAKDWSFPPGVNFQPNYIYACALGQDPVITPPTGAAAAAPGGEEMKRAEMVGVMIMGGIATPIGQPGMDPNRGTPSCIPQPIPNLAQIPNAPTVRDVGVMQPSQLPDFRPPFQNNSVRADLDGNLWIRINQAKPLPGGPVYDIVSREGKLVDRLQVPQGYTVVGFGRGRVVFVAMRDASGPHLARVRLK